MMPFAVPVLLLAAKLTLVATPAEPQADAPFVLSRKVVAAAAPIAVATSYGAMRPGQAGAGLPAVPDAAIRTRPADCIRAEAAAEARSDASIDLSQYDWPGTRAFADHQACLLAIFAALGDRATVAGWVEAVIAPTAHSDCPEIWGQEEVARFGPALTFVWRDPQANAPFIGVMDRAGLWSDDLRAPVHSLLRVTFDADDRPVVVKLERFTLGDRYGLDRCP